MAFPTQGILDNFNRSTGIGPKWTTDSNAGNALSIDVTNTQVQTSVANYCGGVWNPTTFAGDVEAYFTNTTKGASEFNIGMYQIIGATFSSGYVFDMLGSGADTMEIYRNDPGGVNTLLGATVNRTIVDGDSYGILRRCSTNEIIGCYKPAAGPWVVGLTRTDATPLTYAAPVYLFMTLSNFGVAPLGDNFGGGEVLEPKDDIKNFPKPLLRQPLSQGRFL